MSCKSIKVSLLYKIWKKYFKKTFYLFIQNGKTDIYLSFASQEIFFIIFLNRGKSVIYHAQDKKDKDKNDKNKLHKYSSTTKRFYNKRRRGSSVLNIN